MLTLKNRIFWPAAIFCFMAPSSACATKDCTFSKDILSEKQYSDNDSIAVFQRFPKANEVKGVLSNGHLFSLRYWSCHHYGKQAMMFIEPQIQPTPDDLNDHIIQLGRLAISETELKLLTTSIANKPISLSDSPVTMRVVSKEFDEFYVQVNTIGEVIFIEIKLYKA